MAFCNSTRKGASGCASCRRREDNRENRESKPCPASPRIRRKATAAVGLEIRTPATEERREYAISKSSDARELTGRDCSLDAMYSLVANLRSAQDSREVRSRATLIW